MELQVEEMATLIGLLKETSQYDPERNPKRSLNRRNLALGNSYEEGYLRKSQDQSKGWFIVYTPQFTLGAWVGADNPDIHFKSISRGAGSKTALPVWANFARNLQKYSNCSYLLEGEFARPSNRSLPCLNQSLFRQKELEEV
jgi:membrane carboxypeptidase/penicillin-binding protein